MAGQLEYSGTAVSNTAINSIPIQGSSSVKYGNDAIQQLMADQANAITKVADKTGTYTAVKGDYNQLIRATGALALNLTAAATLTAGWCVWVKADGGAVTIDPAGAELINGAATLSLPDGFSAFIVCTGSAFRAMVFGKGDVTLDGTQTLTNKTLTAPTINGMTLTGAITGVVAATEIVSSGVGVHAGSATVAILAPNVENDAPGAGGVYLRPNGYNDPDGQVVARANGTLGLGADGSNALDAVTKQQLDAIGPRIAGLAYGAIGTYVFGYAYTTGLTAGATFAGSSIEPAGFHISASDVADDTANAPTITKGGSALSGTWRVMSRSANATGSTFSRVALFLRIS